MRKSSAHCGGLLLGSWFCVGCGLLISTTEAEARGSLRQASLVYRVRSRTARATQRNPVLENNNKTRLNKQTNKQKTKTNPKTKKKKRPGSGGAYL